MISGTNHSDHSVHNDHLVHTDALRHQHRRTIHILASNRQVLNDPTIVTRIPTDHRVCNITSADQAHPDITRTTMADPPAYQDITPKVHRILNGTQHKPSGNPTGILHSLTAAILMVGESHPIVQWTTHQEELILMTRKITSSWWRGSVVNYTTPKQTDPNRNQISFSVCNVCWCQEKSVASFISIAIHTSDCR